MLELTLLALGAALAILIAGQRIENAALKSVRDQKKRAVTHKPVIFRSAYKNFPQRKRQIGKASPHDQVLVGPDGHVITRKRP